MTGRNEGDFHKIDGVIARVSRHSDRSRRSIDPGGILVFIECLGQGQAVMHVKLLVEIPIHDVAGRPQRGVTSQRVEPDGVVVAQPAPFLSLETIDRTHMERGTSCGTGKARNHADTWRGAGARQAESWASPTGFAKR